MWGFRRPGGSGTQQASSDAGTPRGIRTPDLLLRRQLLYPAELLALVNLGLRPVERVMGIEPTSPAWKAGALAVVLHPHFGRLGLS